MYDIIGFVGSAFSLGGYARVQWQRDFAKTMTYSVMNCIAAALIITSLLHHMNLPVLVSNVIFGIISAYGVFRCWKYIRREQAAEQAKEL